MRAFLEWVQDHDLSLEVLVGQLTKVNGYQTVVITPDGSKEGWSESEQGDYQRQAVIDRLNADNYEDGSSPWQYVEVAYGEYGSGVTATNCRNMFALA